MDKEYAGAMATPADIEQIEREAYARGRADEREELASELPGPTYMDPPDGGSPSIREQFRRMERDAARYRWLIEKTRGVVPMARVLVMRRGQYVAHAGRDLDEAIALAQVTK